MNKKKAFLGAPFADYMNPKTSRLYDDKQVMLTKLIDYLEQKGYVVENSHVREDWGTAWMPPEVCTPLDYELIKEADVFVALPGNPPSGGVHIELGWASALEKRIILLLDESGTYSNLVLGLNTVSPVQTIRYKDVDDVIPQLEVCLQDQSARRILTVSNFYDEMSTSYDSFMEKGESTLEDEINLVLQTFSSPCRILDVGCGTGRIAIPLQQKGYAITGIDVSHGMIQQAKRKGLRNTIQTNLEEFDHSETFDGAISLHAGFSYTNDADRMIRMLQKVYSILDTGGKVLWDSPNKSFYGGQKVLEWPAGNITIETMCYGHNAKHLQILFEQNGFEVRKIWGSYSPLQEYTEGLPRIIIEAERKR